MKRAEDELKMLPRVPQLKTTLSHVSPDKAQQIRSAVTGALQHNQNGLFCFERTVETTFVLPWDLNPRVRLTTIYSIDAVKSIDSGSLR